MSTCYYLNPSGISSWLDILTEKSGIPSDNAPRSWISNMMKKDQNVRWNARMILDDIQEVNSDTDTAFAFSGLCCIEDLASAESVYSATDDSELLQGTDPSNAQSQSRKPEIDILGSPEGEFCLSENLLGAESALKLENKRQIMVGLDKIKHGRRISKEFDKKSNDDVANTSNNQSDSSSVEEMRPEPELLPFVEASNASSQSKLPLNPALQSFEPIKSTEDKKGPFLEIPKPISESQPGEVRPSVSAGRPIAAPECKDGSTTSRSDEKVHSRRLHLNLSSTPSFEHLQLATSSSANEDAATQPSGISSDTPEPLQLLVTESNEASSIMVTPPLSPLGDNEPNEKLKNEAQPGLDFPHDDRPVRSSASMVEVLGTKAGASSNATPLKNSFLRRQFSFEGNPAEMEFTKTMSQNIEKPPTIPASSCNPRVLRHCSKCGKVVLGQFVRALGKTFHLECFSCEVCIT